MPQIRELPRPQKFIQSALANVDSAHWFIWEHGICVGYWDESDAAHSLYCWWSVLDKGFLLQAANIQSVRVVGHQLFILSEEGMSQWDGQTYIDTIPSPLTQWSNHQMAPWGGTGFTRHGYHCWTRGGQEFRLPIGVEKIWHLGVDGQILWSHWGQFFVGSVMALDTAKPALSRPLALEPISDTMEKWFDLSSGWWVAVYEHALVAVHPKYRQKRFDNFDIMDVTMRADRTGILILLATGSVLEWRPQEETEPVEIAEVEGDQFIGEEMIYSEDGIENFIG